MTKRILLLEALGFGFVISVLWANEILDIPHVLFGTSATPVNWMESLLETALMSGLAAVTLLLTRDALNRIKILEGFVPTCALCKRIRVNEQWIPLEAYIGSHSDAQLTHGLCPTCMETEYGIPPRACDEGMDGDAPNEAGIKRNAETDHRGRG